MKHCKSYLLNQTIQLSTVIHVHSLVNQLFYFTIAHVQGQHALHSICQPNHRESEAFRHNTAQTDTIGPLVQRLMQDKVQTGGG
jgi:hypothetical protein